MATITFDPTPQSLSTPPAYAVAVRYGAGRPARLPNVVVLSVSVRAGADPGVARFKYVFDQLAPAAFPSRVEQVLGLNAAGPYVVKQDDRLAVLLFDALGGYSFLFDGFAQVPQGDLGPEHEQATFEAVGVACRCWDKPLGGAVYRDGPNPRTSNRDVATDRPTRFNPDGGGNKMDGGWPSGTLPNQYSPFLDPRYDAITPDGTVFSDAVPWSVADAARYILAIGNDGRYVDNPTLNALREVLCNRQGVDVLGDPAGAPATPIPCHDLDVTGKPWPEALADLVAPHNFDFRFALSTVGAAPRTSLSFFRTDDASIVQPKPVSLQAAGVQLDLSLTNIDGLSVARDGSRVANQIVVESRETRHEVAIVLAPAFAPGAKDASGTNWAAFDSDNPNWSTANQDAYRVYIAGEGGDRYWDFPSSSWKSAPFDFDGVFGAPLPSDDGGPNVPQYANHRRTFRETLFSQVNGEPRKARLFVSKDYNSPIPGLWDRTGSWCEVKSDWEFLPDRLGIRITTPKISKLAFNPTPYPGFGTTQIKGGDEYLSLVECINGNPYSAATSPPDPRPRVFFMVVGVVESDKGVNAIAPIRASSVTQFPVVRRADCRDRFEKNVIAASSIYNTTGGDVSDPQTLPGSRDDTADATQYAVGLRAAVENPRITGTITIPQVALGYQVGDRVSGVAGRGVSLRINGGGPIEGPQFPTIVGVDWSFDGRQSTTLHLSDLRRESMPPPEHQK